MRQEFTSAYRRAYADAYGPAAGEDRASRIKLGLAALPTDFYASECPLCKGTGAERRGYGIACRYCNGSGLVQGCIEAPPSVLNQVLVAAERHRK